MKKLKVGDLVYSKKYGQGIISEAFIKKDNLSAILFEGKSNLAILKREELFVKGDVIRVKKTSTSSWSKYTTTFIGFASHCKKHKYVVAHPVDAGHKTIHSYVYNFDIEHVEESMFTYYNCQSGRYISDCANFQEILKGPTPPDEYVPTWYSQEENRKQQMLKDIQLMKLEATAKGMLEAIEGLKNER